MSLGRRQREILLRLMSTRVAASPMLENHHYTYPSKVIRIPPRVSGEPLWKSDGRATRTLLAAGLIRETGRSGDGRWCHWKVTPAGRAAALEAQERVEKRAAKGRRKTRSPEAESAPPRIEPPDPPKPEALCVFSAEDAAETCGAKSLPHKNLSHSMEKLPLLVGVSRGGG